MPTMYANALRLPWAMGLRGYDLYRSVMDTAISYKLNYEMTFPEMNYYPMLVQYTKELALPGKSWKIRGNFSSCNTISDHMAS